MSAKYSVMVFLGLLAIVCGLVVFFVLADATRKAILAEIVIDSADHKNYNGWINGFQADDESPYYRYYLYNLTNPNEWSAGTAKPNFAEIGPFVYKRLSNKTNVSFSTDGNEVTYNGVHQYFFDADQSVSNDLTTMIFNVNPFYVTALQSAANLEIAFDMNLVSANLRAYTSNAAMTFLWAAGNAPTIPGVTLYPTFYEFSGLTQNLTSTQATAILAAFSNSEAGVQTLLGYLQLFTAYVTAATTYATLAATPGAAAADIAAALAAFGTASTTLNTSFPTTSGFPDYSTPFSWTNPSTGVTSTTTKAGILATYLSTMATASRASLTATAGSNGNLLFRMLPARQTIFGPDPFFTLATGAAGGGFVTNYTIAGQTSKAATVKTGKDSSSYAGMDHHTQANGVTESTAYVRGDGTGPRVKVDGRTNSMSPFQGATPDKLSIYFEEVERYVEFTFNGVQEVEGIETARYLAETEEFTNVNSEYNVTHRGFLPLQYWSSSAPLYLGLPHNDNADAPFSDAVTGLTVNKGAHSTFFDLEPITGYPLEARLAAQNNLLLNFTANTYSGVVNSSEPEVMVPLYWFARTFRISSQGAEDLKVAVVTAVVLRRAILGSLVGLGVVCVLIGAALMVQKGGNDGAAGDAEKPQESKKPETQKEKADDLPQDNEPELQPFSPPPPVNGDEQNTNQSNGQTQNDNNETQADNQNQAAAPAQETNDNDTGDQEMQPKEETKAEEQPAPAENNETTAPPAEENNAQQQEATDPNAPAEDQ